MVEVEKVREAVALARAHQQTHVRLVVARSGPLRPKSAVRLDGRSGPVADRERPIEKVDERSVAAWFDLVSLRIWLDRQRISRDPI
jgi:hypothetical protein